ncbi:MAG: alpha amylase C-terminal domain-containing protein [Deltaproteobacteria bacterium]|nr:alpha amylase C-terminal domain-containing protein [Deltaproteobacteria bacterium]
MNEWNIIKSDPALSHFYWAISDLQAYIQATELRLTQGQVSLKDYATAHQYFGLHLIDNEWVLREWAPHASNIYLIGAFTEWRKDERYKCLRLNDGIWEGIFSRELLHHEDLYRLYIEWPGGGGPRIPAFVRRAVQSPLTNEFDAQVWQPETPYQWKMAKFTPRAEAPLIYEAHVGMAQEEGRVSSYKDFTKYTIPRIAAAGYSAVQLMAILEHPYYGSFGYQVSNFFAPSSRFGTPDDLKELIDTAHQAGLSVYLDIVHSHSVKNEVEGLSKFDGTYYQYFHDGGDMKQHPVWDSRLFNYDNPWVLRFLLSNIRYWVEEFHFDGFRFDGVTSMIYRDHGLKSKFGSYDVYFSHNLDRQAITYLALANKVCHQLEGVITIAEDVSGMPGLAAPINDGGIGFDYRLAMGIPDFWLRYLTKRKDEDWNVDEMFYELANRRPEEKIISYAECHDQALVGDKTFIFQMIDAAMYHNMHRHDHNLAVERGVALHKLIRLATLCMSGHGYLNFMGNEFGHPEWIDFPRQGNNWSYHHARRCWSLRDNPDLYYHCLAEFDREMIKLFRDHNLLRAGIGEKAYAHCADQVLVVYRAGFRFIFNFSPTNSYTDYGIPVGPHTYSLVLNTDVLELGGHGRLQNGQKYHSHEAPGGHRIQLYLPTRTALVLATDSD